MRGKANGRLSLAFSLGVVALTLPGCGPPKAFADKDAAEAWFGRMVILGGQCRGLLDHNSDLVRVIAHSEQSGTHQGAEVTLRAVTLIARYGEQTQCMLERKVQCDDSGKIQLVEVVNRACP